ncbi:LysR family transcriptional regulator [Ruicaihuangia caeni]|uniref:LysR family transcriptional regulator n=1 Tax=Ruicaihuangia caeni TaxID=3042517 RepID=UPI00339031A5
MEIRQLRYAVLLDEHRHFGRAAQAAYITQSAFSQQIAQLERELGVRLFDRTPAGSTPTEAGTRFLEHARTVLANLAVLQEDVRSIADGHSGVLRVGMFGAGAGEFTPLLVDAYRSAAPGIELVFHELSMTRQFDELLDGVVDVAILHPLCDRDDVAFTPLFDEPRLAALPARHELADADAISVADLAEQPFVLAGTGVPDPWRSFWTCGDPWQGAGRPRAEMRSISEGLAAVAYLRVVDTVPATSARYHRHPGVTFVPLHDASYSSVAVARRADDGRPAVEAFCHLADQLAIEHHAVVPGAVRPAPEK